ncbi:DUF4494 domain-containing protein [Spirosoma sp. HMF4905]|uniref:DUF4494 domain-containing protein n=1 Tax=Spirosoma arboris TaxID=2682092 RepID=A0A7K1SKC5_9BACT|nr:DUF4494 family protein [Spirosoma arboris]MVM34257.1 DUF4494 domain-containing protein [Spirosoma arboris]
MPAWYKTRIRFRQLDIENNKYKYISELYLQRAETFADVEHQMQTELAERLKDFKVKGINEFKVAECVLHHVFDPERETEPEEWYLCKVEFSDFKEQILITATSVVEAHSRLEKKLKLSKIPFTIKDVDSTKILGVFDFENEALMQDYQARVGWMEPQNQRAEKQKSKHQEEQIPIPFDEKSDDKRGPSTITEEEFDKIDGDVRPYK